MEARRGGGGGAGATMLETPGVPSSFTGMMGDGVTGSASVAIGVGGSGATGGGSAGGSGGS